MATEADVAAFRTHVELLLKDPSLVVFLDARGDGQTLLKELALQTATNKAYLKGVRLESFVGVIPPAALRMVEDALKGAATSAPTAGPGGALDQMLSSPVLVRLAQKLKPMLIDGTARAGSPTLAARGADLRSDVMELDELRGHAPAAACTSLPVCIEVPPAPLADENAAYHGSLNAALALAHAMEGLSRAEQEVKDGSARYEEMDSRAREAQTTLQAAKRAARDAVGDAAAAEAAQEAVRRAKEEADKAKAVLAERDLELRERRQARTQADKLLRRSSEAAAAARDANEEGVARELPERGFALTFGGGGTLYHTYDRPTLLTLKPDYCKVAPGYALCDAGMVGVIEVERGDAVGNLSNSHRGKVMAYNEAILSIQGRVRDTVTSLLTNLHTLMVIRTEVKNGVTSSKFDHHIHKFVDGDAWRVLLDWLYAPPDVLGWPFGQIMSSVDLADFQLSAHLGHGRTSHVWSATLEGNTVAAKCVYDRAEAAHELVVYGRLRAVNSPCLPRLMGAFGEGPVFLVVSPVGTPLIDVRADHVQEGVATIELLSKAGVELCDVEPRHLYQRPNGRLLFLDVGFARLDGLTQSASSQLVSGTARFASDARLDDPTCRGHHDLVSFVRSIYVISFPQVAQELFDKVLSDPVDAASRQWIKEWWAKAAPPGCEWHRAMTAAAAGNGADVCKILCKLVCPMPFFERGAVGFASGGFNAAFPGATASPHGATVAVSASILLNIVEGKLANLTFASVMKGVVTGMLREREGDDSSAELEPLMNELRAFGLTAVGMPELDTPTRARLAERLKFFVAGRPILLLIAVGRVMAFAESARIAGEER